MACRMGREPSKTFKSFGAYLRAARERRELKLTEAAHLSQFSDISPGPQGRISYSHLSQIEHGRPVRLPLQKVLSLASIYAVPVEEIIDQAPPDLRSKLRQSLHEWRKRYEFEPGPLEYLPRDVERQDYDIVAHLEYIAEDVRVPLDLEWDFPRIARENLIAAALPPFVRGRFELVTEYWTAARKPRERKPYWESPEEEWHSLALDFCHWLLYGRKLGPSIAATISWWTIDFGDDTELCPLWCTFKDTEADRLYGIDGAPLSLVRGVRWRQVAALLSTQMPAQRALCDPPDPANALLDYTLLLIDPQAPLLCSFGERAGKEGVITPRATRPTGPMGRLLALAAALNLEAVNGRADQAGSVKALQLAAEGGQPAGGKDTYTTGVQPDQASTPPAEPPAKPRRQGRRRKT